jgi:hypothetical protein
MLLSRIRAGAIETAEVRTRAFRASRQELTRGACSFTRSCLSSHDPARGKRSKTSSSALWSRARSFLVGCAPSFSWRLYGALAVCLSLPAFAPLLYGAPNRSSLVYRPADRREGQSFLSRWPSRSLRRRLDSRTRMCDTTLLWHCVHLCLLVGSAFIALDTHVHTN